VSEHVSQPALTKVGGGLVTSSKKVDDRVSSESVGPLTLIVGGLSHFMAASRSTGCVPDSFVGIPLRVSERILDPKDARC
jgi:hypothetical protein